MGFYSELLNTAVNSIKGEEEEKAVQTVFDFSGFNNNFKDDTTDDFELVSFLVVGQMINMPERYEVNQEIKLKNLILKEFKPIEKKKIKEYIKSVTLKYMINDEEIPSVDDEKYNFKVIQYFDFEISDIKKAGFLANLYQEAIKSPCILRFYDNSKELYSLALKRLNQNDRNEIVVTDTVMTEIFDLSMSSSAKREVKETLDYSKILNRTNKVNFYSEMFIRNYILKNRKYYQKSRNILESLIWYDRNKMNDIFEKFKNLVMYKEKMKSTIRNSEKVEINKKIRELISELDKYQNFGGKNGK